MGKGEAEPNLTEQCTGKGTNAIVYTEAHYDLLCQMQTTQAALEGDPLEQEGIRLIVFTSKSSGRSPDGTQRKRTAREVVLLVRGDPLSARRKRKIAYTVDEDRLIPRHKERWVYSAGDELADTLLTDEPEDERTEDRLISRAWDNYRRRQKLAILQKKLEEMST